MLGTETLVAAGHVTIYPSKTAGWVVTQVHIAERTIKYPTLPADFSTTQILGGHVTSRNQGLCSNDQGRQRRETLGTRLTKKRPPCWRSKIFFWELNSIFMQIPPFVSLCKYGFWSHERTLYWYLPSKNKPQLNGTSNHNPLKSAPLLWSGCYSQVP